MDMNATLNAIHTRVNAICAVVNQDLIRIEDVIQPAATAAEAGIHQVVDVIIDLVHSYSM